MDTLPHTQEIEMSEQVSMPAIVTLNSSSAVALGDGNDWDQMSDHMSDYTTDEEENLSVLPSTPDQNIKDTHPPSTLVRNIYVNNRDQNSKKTNYIRTTKYTFLTFLPFNLLEQFLKLYNIYFLIVVVISQIPGVTTSFAPLAILPFLLIIGIAMIKDGFEDFLRFLSDYKANNRQTTLFLNGQFISEKTKNIRVGDIVKVDRGQVVPADIILINSDKLDGSCFIETANLDGETNLKIKEPIGLFLDYSSPQQLQSIRAKIQVENPHPIVDQFQGTMQPLVDHEPLSKPPNALTIESLILRGCIVRNTNHILGIVVYVGKDTKIFRNSNKVKLKFNDLDKLLNGITAILFIFHLLLCLALTTAQCVVHDYYVVPYLWYLRGFYKNITVDTLFVVREFLSYFVLLSVMVPRTLYVALEFVKTLQSFYMTYFDEGMCYKGKTMISKTSHLNQDLAKIDIVFSDKTGTITENRMEASQCWFAYNDFTFDFMHFPGTLWQQMNTTKDREEAILLLLSMILNSTVIPEIQNEGQTIIYEGPSADEVALVKMAQQNNIVYQQKISKTCVKVMIFGKSYEFEIQYQIPFNSDRKRMSTLVLDCESQQYYLFCKGADTIMLNLLLSNSQFEFLQSVLDKFSQQALRSLVFGYKIISKEETMNWLKQIDLYKGNFEMQQLLYSQMESQLRLMGCSAVEDKLQENVPESITFLRQAGIAVWMVTGDQLQTAISIARSARIIDEQNCKLFVLQQLVRKQECKKQLKKLLRYIQKYNITSYALALEINTITTIFKYHLPLFVKLLNRDYCLSCICARVTPLLKSTIVTTVSKALHLNSIAIGDGENDIQMIREAKIGIGIIGNEGTRASRVSDYAIHRFYHLPRLMAAHGHYCYIRNADYIHLTIWRSVLYGCCHLFANGFMLLSGDSAFDAVMFQLYNVIYTVLPVVVAGVLEKDLSEETLLAHPQLYRHYRHRRILSGWTVILWCLLGIYYSAVLYFITCAVQYTSSIFASEKESGSIYDSTVMHNVLIVVVYIKHGLHFRSWTYVHVLVLFGNFVLYPMINYAYAGLRFDSLGRTDFFFSFLYMTVDVKVWIFSLFLTVATILPDFVYFVFRRNVFPEMWEKILLKECYKERWWQNVMP